MAKATELIIKDKAAVDEVLLTPEQVAARWSMKTSSLAGQRSQGTGPRYRKFPNGVIRYPDWAVFAYEIGVAA